MNDLEDLPEAIILCGGKGERLRPITNDIPKPLVKINEKPILYYAIKHLKQFNIGKIHIASGYKSEVIEKYISNHQNDAEIIISNSGDVDIIVRIQNILQAVENDVIVLYGDTISDVDIYELIKKHRQSRKKISMTVWPLKITYGLVEVGEDGTVMSFTEKPTLDKWINIGYFYIDKSHKKAILENDSFEHFLLRSAQNKTINAYKHHGIHITINTLSELDDAQKIIKNVITV
jgi:glucose-1-phosphate cytidylyltransferase